MVGGPAVVIQSNQARLAEGAALGIVEPDGGKLGTFHSMSSLSNSQIGNGVIRAKVVLLR
jgi:hypothetical protein